MPPTIDLTGQRYGRLVAVRREQRGRITLWHCKCDCGVECVIALGNLRNGTTKSCGCLRREVSRATVESHGMRDAPEYAIWCAMKQRCCNPNDKNYPHYGKRGIKVCARWQ